MYSTRRATRYERQRESRGISAPQRNPSVCKPHKNRTLIDSFPAK